MGCHYAVVEIGLLAAIPATRDQEAEGQPESEQDWGGLQPLQRNRALLGIVHVSGTPFPGLSRASAMRIAIAVTRPTIVASPG
jgi:hypothetical protein